MGIPWWSQLLVAVGAVVGVVAAIIRQLWAYDSGSHKWQTCKCETCKFKRRDIARREALKRNERARRKGEGVGRDGIVVPITPPKHSKPWWITTTHLEPGMRVGLNGHPYRVEEIRTDRLGYIVSLVNLATKDRFIVVVPFSLADFAYWEPLSI